MYMLPLLLRAPVLCASSPHGCMLVHVQVKDVPLYNAVINNLQAGQSTTSTVSQHVGRQCQKRLTSTVGSP